MILSYRDDRTKDFAEGKRVRAFESFRRQAEKRLDILDSATTLADLRALPSNALEGLRGDRKGQYSIRSISSGGSASSGRTGKLARRTLRLWTTTDKDADHGPHTDSSRRDPHRRA